MASIPSEQRSKISFGGSKPDRALYLDGLSRMARGFALEKVNDVWGRSSVNCTVCTSGRTGYKCKSNLQISITLRVQMILGCKKELSQKTMVLWYMERRLRGRMLSGSGRRHSV